MLEFHYYIILVFGGRVAEKKEETRLKSKVFSLESLLTKFLVPSPSLRHRVKYGEWDRETGFEGPFISLGVA